MAKAHPKHGASSSVIQEQGDAGEQGGPLPCLHRGTELDLGMKEAHKYQELECDAVRLCPQPTLSHLGSGSEAFWGTGQVPWAVAWCPGAPESRLCLEAAVWV